MKFCAAEALIPKLLRPATPPNCYCFSRNTTGDTPMPKVSEMIISKFLRKEDLDDEVVVTLKAVTLEDMPGDTHEQRWVLTFRELAKGLVLNTTTIRVLEKAYGQDSDDWMSKKCSLYVDPNVSFKGQIVGGLRLRPMKPPQKPAIAVQASPKRPRTPATALVETAESTDFPFNDDVQ
jgi:hypothetical protein